MDLVTGIAVGIVGGVILTDTQMQDRRAIQQCFRGSSNPENFKQCMMYSFYEDYKKAMGLK